MLVSIKKILLVLISKPKIKKIKKEYWKLGNKSSLKINKKLLILELLLNKLILDSIFKSKPEAFLIHSLRNIKNKNFLEKSKKYKKVKSENLQVDILFI